MKITPQITRAGLAGYLCSQLAERGIVVVLTGGSVVSIYSDNLFESDDLDFITEAPLDQLREAMSVLGFQQASGKYFMHPDTHLLIEFPAPPLEVGDRYLSVDQVAVLPTQGGPLRILTPTQCVMDRLSAYFHWNDPQSLEQAIAVATRKPVDLEELADWARREGCEAKFQRFLARLGRGKKDQ